MKTVWKYELRGTRVFLDLPVGAQVVHVAVQGGDVGGICLWAEVDPAEPTRRRLFYVVGTGHPIPDDDLPPLHIGSFLTDSVGTFVFHVYESLDQRMTSAMTANDPS